VVVGGYEGCIGPVAVGKERPSPPWRADKLASDQAVLPSSTTVSADLEITLRSSSSSPWSKSVIVQWVPTARECPEQMVDVARQGLAQENMLSLERGNECQRLQVLLKSTDFLLKEVSGEDLRA